MLDIFNNDAFSVVNLTDAANDLAFVPGRISKSGLFRADGITTTTAVIETKGARLSLVAPTPRGAPGEAVNTDKERKLIPISVPHFERNDAVMADEVQGVRAFGSETELETVMGKVAEKIADHSQDLAATTEFSQLGAIKGVVTYADGSELNLFTTMGVAAPGVVNFDAAALKAAKDDGAFRKWCAALVRAQAAELGGLSWTGKVRVFCGDNLFDHVLGNQEVRETFKGWTEAQILREGYIEANGESFGAFEFADVIFENYRGQVGNARFVEIDDGHSFPEGVPGLFRTYHAPADYIETVNTRGRRLYAKQYEMPNGKGVNLDIQMNELNLCTRPKTLRTLRKV
ncbi:major capsid protein [Brevundimonas bacteroides]|uniref:major capsid protein n=1 Tax=Brevundimonas bacteroides TaxID=74311 RepID=UPI0004960DD9|nr:major capsid protein [Brevundimonas bacteroides]